MQLVKSMEAIDFQSKASFGIECEALINELYEDFQNKSHDVDRYFYSDYDKTYVTKIENLIFKRFGILTRLNIAGSLALIYTISQTIGYSNYDLKNNNYLDTIDRYMKTSKTQIGTVSLKTARVGGSFSEKPVYIDIAILYLMGAKEKFTAAEVVAMLLHEIGHAFTNFELANKLESSNLALASFVSETLKNQNQDKIMFTYNAMCEALGEKPTFIDSESNLLLIKVDAFKKHFGYVRTQMGRYKYDETSAEAGADIFATRMGYGKELIIALSKLGTDPSNGITATFSSLQWYGLIAQPVAFLLVASFYPVIATAIIVIYALYLTINRTNGFSSKEKIEYDTDKDRFIRIKKQVVSVIKDRTLPSEIAAEYLDVIASIEKVIVALPKNDRKIGFFNRLFDPKVRSNFKDYELQKQLEDLAYSDLFTSSALLKNSANK